MVVEHTFNTCTWEADTGAGRAVSVRPSWSTELGKTKNKQTEKQRQCNINIEKIIYIKRLNSMYIYMNYYKIASVINVNAKIRWLMNTYS